MKKIIMILSLVAIGLTACKKEDIKPNMGPYIENIDEDIDEGGDIEEDNAHISDSMSFVRIIVKSKSVSMGINVKKDGIDYPVYSNSVDSSVYVSNGWNSYGYGSGSSWSGWIKPESYVSISGKYNGLGNSNVFDFDITVQINNGTPFTKNFNITTSNKTYMHIFYVE